MIDPSKQAAIDQIMAQHLDVLPDFLRKMYLAFYRVGFHLLGLLGPAGDEQRLAQGAGTGGISRPAGNQEPASPCRTVLQMRAGGRRIK